MKTTDYLTIAETAEILHVSKQKVYAIVRSLSWDPDQIGSQKAVLKSILRIKLPDRI